jgi:hypothetical protein
MNLETPLRPELHCWRNISISLTTGRSECNRLLATVVEIVDPKCTSLKVNAHAPL